MLLRTNIRNLIQRIRSDVLSIVEVAVAGLLLAKYPDTRGRNIRIQVDVPFGYPPEFLNLVSELQQMVSGKTSVGDSIAASETIGRLRVVSGIEMGRGCSAPMQDRDASSDED